MRKATGGGDPRQGGRPDRPAAHSGGAPGSPGTQELSEGKIAEGRGGIGRSIEGAHEVAGGGEGEGAARLREWMEGSREKSREGAAEEGPGGPHPKKTQEARLAWPSPI